MAKYARVTYGLWCAPTFVKTVDEAGSGGVSMAINLKLDAFVKINRASFDESRLRHVCMQKCNNWADSKKIWDSVPGVDLV